MGVGIAAAGAAEAVIQSGKVISGADTLSGPRFCAGKAAGVGATGLGAGDAKGVIQSGRLFSGA
jgi:hypothetical protein